LGVWRGGEGKERLWEFGWCENKVLPKQKITHVRLTPFPLNMVDLRK